MITAEETKMSLIYALVGTLENAGFRLDKPGVRAAVLSWIEVAESLLGDAGHADKANHHPLS